MHIMGVLLESNSDTYDTLHQRMGLITDFQSSKPTKGVDASINTSKHNKRGFFLKLIFLCSLQYCFGYQAFYSKHIHTPFHLERHMNVVFENVVLSLVLTLRRFLFNHFYMKSLAFHPSTNNNLTHTYFIHLFHHSRASFCQ